MLCCVKGYKFSSVQMLFPAKEKKKRNDENLVYVSVQEGNKGKTIISYRNKVDSSKSL